jgi:hypothetical protein
VKQPISKPGPIERRLFSRLHFKLLGYWPRAVVDERLANATFDPTNVNAILAEVWGKDQK